MFKKFISSAAAVAVLACISAAPLSVSAENSKIQFEIGTVSTTGEIRDGVLVNEESVLVPVDITENEGVATFMLEFTLDSNLQLTAFITKQCELPGGGFTHNKDALRILWTEGSCQDVYTCGNVLNLKLTVPAGTPVGQYEIGFNGDEIQLTNSNFESMDVNLISGYVNVGGDPQNDTPVITEPAVTNPPETPAPAPAVQTTQNVPSKVPADAGGVNAPQKDPQTTTVDDNAAPAATSAPNNNNNSSNTSAADSNVSQAVTTTAAAGGNSAADAVSSQTDAAAVTGDNSAEVSSSSTADSKNDSKSSSNDKSSASSKTSSASNKTSNSPSTGAGGIAVAGVVLTISAVGAVAAYKAKKNNR